MVSQLESAVRQAVGQAFKGQLLPGVLRRAGTPTGVDDFGDPERAEDVEYPFEGIVDTYRNYYAGGSMAASSAAIPQTDVKVIIIAASLAVSPQKQDRVRIRDKWYQIRDFTTDPALATWECQSFEIPAPE